MFRRSFFLSSTAFIGLACGLPNGGSGVALRVPSAERPPAASISAARSLWQAELRTKSGKCTRLSDLAGGQAIIVVLWAPWCAACRSEQPLLTRLVDWAHRHGGFKIVTVRIDPEAGDTHDNDLNLQSVQLIDVDDVFASYGDRRVPATLVFSEQGVLVHAGAAVDAAALRALKKVIP
jgi:thiol-disulfide isomerase/thioredoxin